MSGGQNREAADPSKKKAIMAYLKMIKVNASVTEISDRYRRLAYIHRGKEKKPSDGTQQTIIDSNCSGLSNGQAESKGPNASNTKRQAA